MRMSLSVETLWELMEAIDERGEEEERKEDVEHLPGRFGRDCLSRCSMKVTYRQRILIQRIDGMWSELHGQCGLG